MKQAIMTNKTIQSNRINRYAYGIYLLLVVYLLIKGDYEWAVTNMGIALAFDPFDATVKWHYRPFYQKAWLVIHLVLLLSGLATFF